MKERARRGRKKRQGDGAALAFSQASLNSPAASYGNDRQTA